METNAVPYFDDSVNETGCCPRFNPEGWNGAELHFENKPFLRAISHSALHIPIDMGRIFTRVNEHIQEEDAQDPSDFIILTRDISAWNAEHFFSVTKPVPSEEMTTLSGDFVTKVFEGPYRKAKDWYGEMEDLVRARGSTPTDIYIFYTTCPKCAKAYGKNYVVGVARL